MSGLARLLIVDDEVQIRNFLCISLRAAGYEVLQAATGREAIQTCAHKKPELVLLDLGLPDISGHEVIRVLRTRSQVPIIVLSVRGEDADKVTALDAGANDYVQKPFSTMASCASMFRRMKFIWLASWCIYLGKNLICCWRWGALLVACVRTDNCSKQYGGHHIAMTYSICESISHSYAQS